MNCGRAVSEPKNNIICHSNIVLSWIFSIHIISLTNENTIMAITYNFLFLHYKSFREVSVSCPPQNILRQADFFGRLDEYLTNYVQFIPIQSTYSLTRVGASNQLFLSPTWFSSHLRNLAWIPPEKKSKWNKRPKPNIKNNICSSYLGYGSIRLHTYCESEGGCLVEGVMYGLISNL